MHRRALDDIDKPASNEELRFNWILSGLAALSVVGGFEEPKVPADLLRDLVEGGRGTEFSRVARSKRSKSIGAVGRVKQTDLVVDVNSGDCISFIVFETPRDGRIATFVISVLEVFARACKVR